MPKLRFFGATLKSLCWYPAEETDSTFVLLVRAPLTVALADALGCRGLCYSEPDGNAQRPKGEQVPPSPRRWDGKIGAPVEIGGGDISLGERTFPFSLAHKFTIEREDKSESTGVSLFVTARVHCDGKEVLLYKFCQDQKKSKFSFSLTPAQGAFHFMDGEETTEGDESDSDEPKSSGAVASKATMAKAN